MSFRETDEELARQYKEGEKGAFKLLVERYTPLLYNYAARFVGRDNAEDMVQDIFIKAWRNIGRFDPDKASWKTWIFTISRNRVTDFLRKKKTISFSDLENPNEDITFSENIPGEDNLPSAELEKLEDKELLEELLQKLRPNYREVLVLHYQEDMTFEEIGKVLGKPLNTVKSDHFRAIRELRKML
ncbi:MAG TPA: RNA polymerase sigma factor [Candidatus Paceibacterota bacterium]|jgi:RNA polymerase sigma-70 factor (ECF subfamily)|nr:RNA polymerase sigma factor [Candidatus Paceibacterota bacterium]